MSLSTQSNEQNNKRKNYSQIIFELVLFAMLGALMFASKVILELLPNIHLLGMFTMVFTLVFRSRALIPIYLYVFLNGIYAGFQPWWIPYLYLWTVLWGITMLLPRRMPTKLRTIVYPIVCALHGLLFGVLYAPAQAIMFGFDFKQTIAWVISGLPFDIVHAIGNLASGFLIVPFCNLLLKLLKKSV